GRHAGDGRRARVVGDQPGARQRGEGIARRVDGLDVEERVAVGRGQQGRPRVPEGHAIHVRIRRQDDRGRSPQEGADAAHGAAGEERVAVGDRRRDREQVAILGERVGVRQRRVG
ncbi:hypothetical protein RZS08_02620, partial [Arthrospira platensis SPKY1]|nr:hypothetical protein [Arthrospira platensis SPKY1]